MWSNAKRFVGGALAALVAAAVALALAVVPAEADEGSPAIDDVGTYSVEVLYAGYAEPYVLFDVPESGVYCLEFSFEEGALDFISLEGDAICTEYNEETDGYVINFTDELYERVGDTSTTVIFQLEAGHSYEIYYGYIAYDATTIQLTVTRVGTDAEGEDFVPVWRLYNPYTGEHHFTVDQNEYSTLVSLGWTGEGICWLAPTTGDAVYRLYNQWSGDHHYTTNATEYAALLVLGWTDEGVGWYSSGSGTAVYRLYNPYAESFYHHYTVDANEYATLLTLGWSDEQVGWYGL